MNNQDVSSTFAWVFVEELFRLGVRQCCIAPGARSSAISIALAAHKEITTYIFADERSAAFTALGIAKTKPKQCIVAVLTTSGTAVANLFPATIEASESEIPFLLITADRPPELRHSRANQSIYQPNIFGSYVRQSIDFAVPNHNTFHHSLSQLDHLIFRSLYPIRGPVHANVMFREPIGTDVHETTVDNIPIALKDWQKTTAPYTTIVSSSESNDELFQHINKTQRGIIVVGSLPLDKRADVESLIRTLNWPVMADAASGLHYRNIDNLVWMYDTLIRETPTKFNPETVIRIGHTFSSKWVDHLLLKNVATGISIDWSYTRTDPESNCNHIIITNSINSVTQRLKKNKNEWNTMFYKHNQHIKSLFTQQQSPEILLMKMLSDIVPTDGILCVGNSMPIRDFSACAISNRPDVTIFCNRGASGIDGMISTAAGLAVETEKHCTLVLGDLSAIHDLSALLYLKELPISLRIIIINNSGGGIFHQLPLAKSPFFSPTFDAPHKHHLSKSTQSFSIPSQQIVDLNQLQNIPVQREHGIQVIELLVDKPAELKQRSEWFSLVRTTIASLWGD